MIPFKVLLFEFNKKTPTYYDIMPYLINRYKLNRKESLNLNNFECYKVFVLDALRFQFWSRCEYEFVMVHWPYKEDNPLENSYKIAIFEQCKMNIDIIVKVFIENISEIKKE